MKCVFCKTEQSVYPVSNYTNPEKEIDGLCGNCVKGLKERIELGR